MKKLLIALSFCSLSTVWAQTIDASKSYVSFSISKLVVNTVEGQFTGMNGKVKFNESNPLKSSFDVCVDASSVKTDSEKRDKHLKTEDFFHVAKYPNICFKSKKVVKTDAGYSVEGSLTMIGVTKNVSIPFTYANKTLTGNFMVKRRDYNLAPSKGALQIGEEVSLKIVCVLQD